MVGANPNPDLQIQYSIQLFIKLYVDLDCIYGSILKMYLVCIYGKKVFGFGLFLRVMDLDCIYVRNYFEYLDFIYELCQDLDLQVVDLCPPLEGRG